MTRYQKHKIFSLFLIFALVLTMLPTMAFAEDTNEDEDIFAENGWEIVPYSTNMADEKVDARLIGFCLNGAESDGSDSLALSNDWQINEGDSLTLDYDAVVSATSEPIDEQVLTVVFVIGWA